LQQAHAQRGLRARALRRLGAAVVLADGGDLDAAGLRAYAGEHLAKFKIPKHVVFVTEIPKGATGKLQRIGLAEKLGLGD
ncbi:MAG: AMP-binding enzyme, partial [Thalassobaculaceae bacterium]